MCIRDTNQWQALSPGFRMITAEVTAHLPPPVKAPTLKRVIVTPAVYPRLIEFLHFDIQSTGQKSHYVSTIFNRLRNALF